jgi:hypothetical protein
MKTLIQKCWNGFQQIKTEPFVIQNSIPILWFGDLEAYLKSDLRIVTVGLNPSNVEFLPTANKKKNYPYSVDYRFPKAKSLVGKSSLSPKDIQLYEDSMNAYYTNSINGKTTWYKPWFGNYEVALHAFDASYISSSNKRTAIHIDLWSPIATEKWRDLKDADKNILQSCAGFTFQELLNKINPHVIITCMNREFVKQNFNNSNNVPCEKANASFCFEKASHKGQTCAYIRAYHLMNDRVLIWGNSGSSPFSYQSQSGDISPQMQNIRNIMGLP